MGVKRTPYKIRKGKHWRDNNGTVVEFNPIEGNRWFFAPDILQEAWLTREEWKNEEIKSKFKDSGFTNVAGESVCLAVIRIPDFDCPGYKNADGEFIGM